MADALPVCDVLSEATEYLSKLGFNLKARADNLREKKISTSLLKNTHAVQKAANKVLLICELSKKSLDNVEAGVKNLLSQIGVSQGSNSPGSKISRQKSDSNIPYQYFEYESEQLKIRKKISLAHYTSVKVVAKTMPSSMLKNYPVYYDCKLFRLRKKTAKHMNQSEDIVNSENGKEFSVETSEVVDEVIPIEPNNTCSVDVIPQTETEKNNEEEVVHDPNNTIIAKENLIACDLPDRAANSSPRSSKTDSENVEMSTVKCNIVNVQNTDRLSERPDFELAEGNMNNKIRNKKKKKYKHIKTFSGSSESEKEEQNDNKIIKKDSICADGTLVDETSDKNEYGKIENPNLEKDSEDTKCADSKKGFLKCININKLLQVPKEDNECIIIEDDIVLKEQPKKSLQKKNHNYRIKNKPIRNSELSNKERIQEIVLAEEQYRKLKRKQMKSFKSKEFSINVHRLPNFSVKFLKTHKINKITKSNMIICTLESCSENQKEGCHKNNAESRKISLMVDSKGREKNLAQDKNVNAGAQVADVIESTKTKFSCNSDSDTTENDIDHALLEAAENVKKSLLNDSDSDSNNIIELNMGADSESRKNKENSDLKKIENLDKQQTSQKLHEQDKNSQESLTENLSESNEQSSAQTKETGGSSSLKALSDEDSSTVQNKNIDYPKSLSDNDIDNLLSTSQTKEDSNENDASQDIFEEHEPVKSPLPNNSTNSGKYASPNPEANQESSKTSLPNDAPDQSLTSKHREGRNDKNTLSPQPNDNPKQIKSSSLDDYSDDSSSSEKRKDRINKDPSPQPNDNPEQIKSSLLDDSSSSKKRKDRNIKHPSPQPNNNPEKITSSLFHDSSDDSSSSEKRKDRNDKDPSPQPNDNPEKIKSSLLHDSSNDSSSSEKRKDRNNKDTSPQPNDNPEQIKSSLFDDSSNDSSSSEKRKDRNIKHSSPQPNDNPEKIISSLFHDSGDDSSSSEKRIDRNNKDPSSQPNDNPEKIKSSLLHGSSDDSSSSEKGKDRNNKDPSPQPNDNPEKIKSSLLNDSSDNASSTSHKIREGNGKDTSSHLSDEPGKIKSSLLNDSSDASSSSHKTNLDSEKTKALNDDQEEIKLSLLNDYSDCSPIKSQKGKEVSETYSPPKSKRKRIMENMHAKKMLLTYSSSDTDDEQLKEALKEIKDSLLKDIPTDGDDKQKTDQSNDSGSSSDEDMKLLSRKKRKSREIKSTASEDGIKSVNKKRKITQGEIKKNAENSNSFSDKVKFKIYFKHN